MKITSIRVADGVSGDDKVPVGQRDQWDGEYSRFNTPVKNCKSSFSSLRYKIVLFRFLRQKASVNKRDTQNKYI